ncbi:MAG: MarR family transcriptional regulator [Firmicutes bacterium]|nr:MarR family transcriptional regulator [Bacillota bacterium]
MDKLQKSALILSSLKDIHLLLKQGMKKVFRDYDLTIPQLGVVHVLMKKEKAKVSEIGNQLKLKDSTVSGILDRLEAQGLVERTRSKEDRRVVYVRLSDKFKVLHSDLHNRMNEYMEILLSNADEEELSKIIDGLGTLKRVLESNVGTGGGIREQNN